MTTSKLFTPPHPKTVAKLPRALALLRDDTRKGCLRVVGVCVVERWDDLNAAGVTEIKTGVPHVLPFVRLTMRKGWGLRQKLLALLELPTAPDEKSAVQLTMAGAGAV